MSQIVISHDLILCQGEHKVGREPLCISPSLSGDAPLSLRIAPEFGSQGFELIPAVIYFIKLLFHRA